MRASSIGYLIRQGVSSLWNNRMMTLASIGVLSACLLIVGFAVLLTENINYVVGFVESQNEVVVFLYQNDERDLFVEPVDNVASVNNQTALEIQSDFMLSNQTENAFRQRLIANGMSTEDLTTLFGESTIQAYTPQEMFTQTTGYPVVYWDRLILQTQAALAKADNVESVRFVSKEEGLNHMRQSFGDLSYLLSNYTGEENPIANSFVVKVSDLAKLDQTQSALTEIPAVKLVNASNEVASTLVGLRRIVNVAGWFIVLALSIVSLLIIINTIRASIFTRRKELGIMKYVGATNAFIRIPFLIEGLVLGIISSAVAYLIIWSGYSMFMRSFAVGSSSWINQLLTHIITFDQVSGKLFLFFGIAGVGIGVFGSLLSIRNHIKV